MSGSAQHWHSGSSYKQPEVDDQSRVWGFSKGWVEPETTRAIISDADVDRIAARVVELMRQAEAEGRG